MHTTKGVVPIFYGTLASCLGQKDL